MQSDYTRADAAMDAAIYRIEKHTGHRSPWHCAECGGELTVYDVRDCFFEYSRMERKMFNITSHSLESRCCDAEVI